MRMVDLLCPSCGKEEERLKRSSEEFDRSCSCGAEMDEVVRPQRHYRPWEPYFDEGLGVFVTGKDHRRRVMRDLKMDFKDHPSAGDLSARVDRAMEARKEAVKRGERRSGW